MVIAVGAGKQMIQPHVLSTNAYNMASQDRVLIQAQDC